MSVISLQGYWTRGGLRIVVSEDPTPTPFQGDPELVDWLRGERLGPNTAALVVVDDPCCEPEGEILFNQ